MFFETALTARRIERETASGAWPGRVLWADAAASAMRHPERVAIVDRRGSCTFGDVTRMAGDLALGLLDAGVRPGDVVTVQLPNWSEFVIAMLAVERIGAVVNRSRPSPVSARCARCWRWPGPSR